MCKIYRSGMRKRIVLTIEQEKKIFLYIYNRQYTHHSPTKKVYQF
jgi:hypothetical protein